MTEINKTLQDLDAAIKRVKAAQLKFKTFSQDKVNAIFHAAAAAAAQERIPLAKMAASETRMGVVEDKVIKNHFAAEYIYNKYKDAKTCGIISSDAANGTKIVAEPLGVIAGIVPTTNPTSTVIFKALICLKTRNGIIFSPHPRAKQSTIAAARIIAEAAVKAGAPEGIIGWIDEPSLEQTNFLITHPDVDCILATGGPGMVKAAYSSGKPALGVGAGNTPAIIDETADIAMAVSYILMSKTFDNGMICASEQSVVAVEDVYDEVRAQFVQKGAYLLKPAESKKLAAVLMTSKGVNPLIVGQPAVKIAEMAGLKVPADTKILLSEQKLISRDNPYSLEKLSPVLTLYKAADYKEAVDYALKLVSLGGLGHTSVLYTDPRTQERIDYFANLLPTGRILVNQPSSQGGIGDLFNFRLEPSLTLGCGSWGGNSVSENVGVKHLLNYKTVAERRENMLWFRVPPKIYFKRGAVDVALRELAGKKRAFIVTDKFLFDSGTVNAVSNILEEMDIEYQIFFDVKSDPCVSTINEALRAIKVFKPDVFIAFGGGSPMDAAKIMQLKYEHPEIEFSDIALRFMDIRKRICSIPPMQKSMMVAIPTTSGTGSEVTPFAVITDDDSGVKYALADYALTPDMAIIDANFVDNMPQGLTSAGGIDALVHAIEAYVSVMATNFTNSTALEAAKQVFKYLPRSYHNGAADPLAREKMHHAATIAGMAFANSFLGLCHSMAHKLGAAFHIAHGVANALLISQIIKYNADETKHKQTIFSQYRFPEAKKRYGQIADNLGLKGKTDDEKVRSLISAIEDLKKDIDIPSSIKAYGISKKDFTAKLDWLVENAFDDQCTGANPSYPLMEDIRQIYLDAFEGKI
ncbi:MAG: bifunctional acetaldehyde-CoA/alcohol dehydrogenase [Alphaproteobacteria bacterium]|nr:bifunctional acetaldehyde-CoA/alcohol dehydrogenase [Alphaproteobacteria bacterium]